MSVLGSLQCAGVERSQDAAAEGHREDRHPDAGGLSPAHTTGPGGRRTLRLGLGARLRGNTLLLGPLFF